MGTIVERARKGGSIGYTAQIRLRKDGRKYTETQTFDRKQAAAAWLKKRERELSQPGALETAGQQDPTLAEVIDRYIKESVRDLGKTKQQVLRTIKSLPIAGMKCSEIDSPSIVQMAQTLKVKPQTVGNYVSHLAAVFAIARPAWNYPLSQQAVNDARVVLQRLGAVSKSVARHRRPTFEELDALLSHFDEIRLRRADSIPMRDVIAFAIFSTRRLEEICRIAWADLDEANSRVLVRDLKHPGQKIGNHVWCDLPPEALRIAQAQPRMEDRVFPYNGDSVSAAFTRACQFLAIEDLHLHDMRHEGTSRLFEMGLSIPHAAAVTGHRSWASLKRYTHLRHVGDRFANWKWLDKIAPKDR